MGATRETLIKEFDILLTQSKKMMHDTAKLQNWYYAKCPADKIGTNQEEISTEELKITLAILECKYLK
jgi:hypothetical protein